MAKKTETNQELTFNSAIIHAVQAEQVAETARAKKGVVSQELMELARSFVSGNKLLVGTAPNGKKDERGEPTGFLGACYEAEQFIKSDDANHSDIKGSWQVEAIPSCWGVAKSRIKRAYNDFGLLPVQFDTESEMRKAVNEAIEAAKSDKASTVSMDVTEENSSLVSRLDTLFKIGEKLDGSDYGSFLETLDSTIEEYTEILNNLVPNEPIQEQAQDAA